MIRTTSLINLLTGLSTTPETKTETMRKGQGFNKVNENTIRVDLRHLDDLFMLDGSAHNVLIVDPENAVFFGEKVTVYALAEFVDCGNIRWMYPVTDKEGNIIEEMALWTCERSEAVMNGVMSFLTDEAPAEGHAEKPVKVHAKRPVEVKTPAKPATLEELIRAHRSAANTEVHAKKPVDQESAKTEPKKPVGRRAVIHRPE